jgi:hypothetical protein
MWNSPRNHNLILAPKDIGALCLTVGQATLDFEEAPCYVSEPYDKIDPRILAYESFRLMHTLVTNTPVPDEGNSAIEEALLYDILSCVFEVGSDQSRDRDPNVRKSSESYVVTINNLLRRAGRRKQVSIPIKLDEEYWQCMVLDNLFFWDRDWQLGAPVINALSASSGFRNLVGIADDYFNIDMRIPTDEELRHARCVFHKIYECAEKGKPLPKSLPNIESLVQQPLDALAE